ncbi:hypothetical protein B0H13DRAFT_1858829 [Mycena leptocephala]|nr:hypothetical protein B0H13DRAFT_1858829 [Mycena leptocephala]
MPEGVAHTTPGMVQCMLGPSNKKKPINKEELEEPRTMGLPLYPSAQKIFSLFLLPLPHLDIPRYSTKSPRCRCRECVEDAKYSYAVQMRDGSERWAQCAEVRARLCPDCGAESLEKSGTKPRVEKWNMHSSSAPLSVPLGLVLSHQRGAFRHAIQFPDTRNNTTRRTGPKGLGATNCKSLSSLSVTQRTVDLLLELREHYNLKTRQFGKSDHWHACVICGATTSTSIKVTNFGSLRSDSRQFHSHPPVIPSSVKYICIRDLRLMPLVGESRQGPKRQQQNGKDDFETRLDLETTDQPRTSKESRKVRIARTGKMRADAGFRSAACF